MQHNLPKIQGEYKFDFDLKNIAFFRVGGKCDIFFTPKNEDDLINFFQNKPDDLEITILGNMSNVLILDGGIRGCVVNLKFLDNIEFYENNTAKVESGVILSKFIKKSIENNLSSCEKLYCIPGTIGGAISMNAGIPNFEISDVLVSIDCLDFKGNKKTITKENLNMSYRNGNVPREALITSCILKTFPGKKEELELFIKDIMLKRRSSQPIGQPTCGSTFKNPKDLKAWQLIKESGCDTLKFGGAIVSDIHCNFLINSGDAKASDFLELIKIIKEKVLKKTGVLLEEEVITIGENL